MGAFQAKVLHGFRESPGGPPGAGKSCHRAAASASIFFIFRARPVDRPPHAKSRLQGVPHRAGDFFRGGCELGRKRVSGLVPPSIPSCARKTERSLAGRAAPSVQRPSPPERHGTRSAPGDRPSRSPSRGVADGPPRRKTACKARGVVKGTGEWSRPPHMKKTSTQPLWPFRTSRPELRRRARRSELARKAKFLPELVNPGAICAASLQRGIRREIGRRQTAWRTWRATRKSGYAYLGD